MRRLLGRAALLKEAAATKTTQAEKNAPTMMCAIQSRGDNQAGKADKLDGEWLDPTKRLPSAKPVPKTTGEKPVTVGMSPPP
ncbi:MAG: hypothetical protein RMJ03_06375, partial [Nitrososphaerota archaeon]|nr:hypothetical protein [Nitrososphaerota archaeon]